MSGHPDIAEAQMTPAEWLEQQAECYAALLADQPRNAPTAPTHLAYPGAQHLPPVVDDLAAIAQELRDAQVAP